MAKKHGEKRKKSNGLIAAVVILMAVFAGAGAWVWFGVLNKPAMVLGSPEITLEAGESFDEWTMVRSLDHVDMEQVSIDVGNLDTSVPGTYEVTYSMHTLGGEDSLPIRVTVKDTVPPVLRLVEEPRKVMLGDTVNVMSLVTEVTDNSPVFCIFENGEPVYTFTEGGSISMGVIARDSFGNESSGTVHFEVEVPDSEPPQIIGAVNTAAKVGEVFDPMFGITVTDDRDPSPVVTASVDSIDTSRTGAVVVHYTATDNTGKISEAERIVTVADEVISSQGTRCGVYWDLTGLPDQPYLVAVNRSLNTVTVYQQDESSRYTVPVRAFVCSTGANTPPGYFKTLERYRWHYLYEDCWGQYATRIVGHILFHSVPYHTENPADLEFEEYNLLGTSASLGCVRLCVEDVKWIYDNCPTGFPCVIYDDSVTPGPLGTPSPILIDLADERRGWDPTDPDPANPWRA